MQGEAEDPGKSRRLRQRAERELAQQAGSRPKESQAQEAQEALPAEEAQRLLHDLRLHQIELEMQNAELLRIQAELLAARDKYAELYDLAPVGYVTVGQQGLILEANLTLAQMLEVERGRLIRRRLSRFMTQDSGDTFYLHRRRLAETGGPQVCELEMVAQGGRQFWVRLEAVSVPPGQGEGAAYRAAVSDITVNKQAEEALRNNQKALAQYRKELRALAGRLMKTHEEHRRQMARDLHDDFNQRLAMLTVDLEALEQRVPLPVKELRGELGGLKGRLAELCEDVRRMAYQLHPSALEHLGLAAALRSYCSEFTRHEKIRVQFACRGDDRAVPQDVALCLYRVAQEALHNAARHSGSERVSVTLGETCREIRLEVADQGKGFDLARVRGKGGLGLISMAEWTRLAKGSLVVRSRPGAGTQVRVRVRLAEAGTPAKRAAAQSA